MRPSPRARRRRLVLPLLVTVLLVYPLLGPQAFGLKQEPRGKLILFVVDQVSLSELGPSKFPHLSWLIRHGAVGAMNTRTAGGSVSAGFVTLGAGNKAVGTETSVNQSGPSVEKELEGFNAGEQVEGRRAADIYRQRTGRTVTSRAVVDLAINQVRQANAEEDLGTEPGALGEALHRAGLTTAMLGNSDTASAYGRSAIAAVMDERGRADYGDVSRAILKRDPAFPTGLRTDRDKLIEAFSQSYKRADVIAIDWGDTSRVEAEAGYLSSSVRQKKKQEALREADRFLGDMLDMVDLKRDRIIVLSANVSADAVKAEDLLTETIMAGKGVERGILTTASTKRDGVLVNVDIAPTVLSLFGVQVPSEMTGQEIQGKRFAGDPVSYLETANRAWVTRAQLDAPALRVVAAWDVILIAAFAALLLTPGYRKYARRPRFLLLSVPVLPLVLLLVPLLGATTVPLVLVHVALLTTLLVALLSWQTRDSADPLIAIGLATVAAVTLDLLAGGGLAGRSLIGSSVITGARFYGIGNEFAGVLVGATIVGTTALLDRLQSKGEPVRKLGLGFAAVIMVLVAFLIGYPGLGVNFGMLLASLAAFGLTMLGFVRGKIGWREVGLLALVSLLIIVAFFLYDMARSAQAESHLGRLIDSIRLEGAAPLLRVVERKAMMNLKLVQFAFWNWVNVASLAVLLVSAYSLKGLIKQVSARHAPFKWALVGGIVGCLAALVFNDSGVVAMAMIFLFLVPITLYLMAGEAENLV